jgi:ribonuclease VapC
MFVDASALSAIFLEEPDADALEAKLAGAKIKLISAVAVFETICAVARERQLSIDAARATVARYLAAAEFRHVPIGEGEREAALDALARYGKGRHPARLNMGDCFAYACARAHGVPLLFKGDDFTRTDIEAA